VAGGVLGAITATFARVPGLLVMVPAAIGLRGNIFGAFGNRVSTSIHAGTFRLSLRRETVLGQNLLAAAVLTAGISLGLAVIAKVVAVALGIEGTVGVLDLAVISIVGGAIASAVVMAATLALTAGAVRRDWDLDSVTAPIVSVLGDVLTLPALWLAAGLVGYHLLTPSLGVVLCVASVVIVVVAARSRLDDLRRITRESLPVLLAAATVSTLAGIALEKRFELFDQYPALLVLVPAHLSSAGALGGILSGRVSTKLLLGTAEPTTWPQRSARSDIWFVTALALPVYAFNGIGAHYTARLLGQASPGLPDMLAVSLIGGAAALAFVAAIAYLGDVVAVRTGVDPDTYGIPVVSSSLDLVGAFTLIVTISALGIV
jgi:mgtE-like transporter